MCVCMLFAFSFDVYTVKNTHINCMLNTFCCNPRISLWQLLVFTSHFRHHKRDRAEMEGLRIPSATSVDWRSFYSEATEFWLGSREPIGGPGAQVETDEALLARRKDHVRQGWAFGGIERQSKFLCSRW